MRNRTNGHGWTAFLLLLGLGITPAMGHTISNPRPFHLEPGDYFKVDVAGGTFADATTVQARFTLVGGSPLPDVPAEDAVANTSVGIRLSSSLAVGQYDVKILIGGVANTGADVRIWVRNLPFKLISQAPNYLPSRPSTHHKDSDFGDVDGDGLLDIFESLSTDDLSDGNRDRLLLRRTVGTCGNGVCEAGLGESCTTCSADCDAGPPCCGAAGQCADPHCVTGGRACSTGPFADATGGINSVAGLGPNNRTYDADLVDLDLDGDLDLVRIDRGSETASKIQLRVLLNDGTGSFTDRTISGPALLPTAASINAVAASAAEVDTGDVDGDGRPDILVCSWSSGAQNALLLNRLHTTGVFELVNDNPCNPSAGSAHALCKVRSNTNRGCAFGNFNTDTKLDIILPSMEGSAPDIVLLNTGNTAGVPQFSVETTWVKAPDETTNQAGVVGGDLKVADVDGDNDDDVVIASPWTNQGRILWNKAGTALVQLPASRYPVPAGSYDATFGDVDRDGDLDVFFGPYGAGLPQAVLINRGGKDGSMKFEARDPTGLWFRPSSGGPVSFTPNLELSMSPGDFDLDGDLDLLTGGFAKTELFENDLFDAGGQVRDWVFAVDRTLSMVSGGKDFFAPAKNVVATFLGQRQSGDLVGLVSYDYTGSSPLNANAPDDVNKAHLEYGVGPLTTARINQVNNLLIGSCTGFCTAIGQALRVSKDAAVAAPDADREKIVVLVTDGRQNQAPHPDTVIPTFPSHVRLYIIALGTDTDDRMLSSLATNGGKFYFAGRSSDYASVQSDMRDVDEDVEAHATGKQVLSPLRGSISRSPAFAAVLRKTPLLPFQELDGGLLDPPPDVDYFIVDPDDKQVRFTLNWRGVSEGNRLEVIDPAGRTYPDPADPLSRERRDLRFHVIEVLDPLSGVWTARQVVGPQSGPAKLTAIASSELRLTARPDFQLFYTGESLAFTATLSQAAAAGATAQIRTPSEATLIINGEPSGQGFHFSGPTLSEPGTYKVRLMVFGPPQRPFVRSWESAVHVAEPTAGEPDLRGAALTLDRTELVADGAATATVRLALKSRDGAGLPGAAVSFVVSGGTLAGTVQDHGDGSYSQTLTAGTQTGAGEVWARVGLTRLADPVSFTLVPGAVDVARSRLTVLVGPGALCTNQQARLIAQVAPVDAAGNPIAGAAVEIESSGPAAVDWDGPAAAVGAGEVYERAFWGPEKAGAYEFSARVNGTPLAGTIVLDVYPPNSPEGELLGCVAIDLRPHKGARLGGLLWLILLILLLLLVVLWWLSRRRKGSP